MVDVVALDEVVDAFLAERIDFARFCELMEAQLAIRPDAAPIVLARLDLLRESGQLSPGLCALVARALGRGAPSHDTVPFEEPRAEGGDGVLPASSDDAGDLPPDPKTPPLLVNTPSQAPRLAAIPGVVLAGRYRLEALLERGGMGMVYRATDLRGGEHGPDPAQVGLKLVNPDFRGRGARRALEREASLLVELSHPGVVRMLGFEHDDGHAFMTMELLEGERLTSRLQSSAAGGLPVDEAMRVIRELAEILAYLHQRGVVHRDVKPANVFLTSSTGVRLVDFGLAARTGERDHEGEGPPRAGTPLYASPEMLAGAPADPREDVYSLACVAYELLAGKPPEQGVPGSGPDHGKCGPARPPGLTSAQWQTLKHALSPEASERPRDAAAFLESFFAPSPQQRILPWAAVALVGGVIIGAGLAWVGSLQIGPGPGPELQQQSEPEPAATVEPVPEPEPESTPQPAPARAEPQPAPETQPAPEAQPSPEPRPAPEPQLAPEARPAPEPQPAPRPVVASPPAAAPARPAGLALAASRMRISESGTALRLELSRPARYQGPLRVMWRTVDQTARDGRDFIGSPEWQLAQAPASAASLVIFIPIVNDSIPGPDVAFLVEIRAAPQGPPLGAPARAEVTIVDDD